MNEELYHYGTKYHSGRYPYGSGEEPFQHDSIFLDNVKKLRSEGYSNTEIAKALGMSTTEFRERDTIERASLKKDEYAYAINLKNQGFSNVVIGEKLGRNESYIRKLLSDSDRERVEKITNIASYIKDSVDTQNYIDIGSGSEKIIGIAPTKFRAAVRYLKDQGYHEYYLKVPQAGIPGQYTSVKVLAKPEVTYSELISNREKLGNLENNQIPELYTTDGGKTILGIEEPVKINPDRIKVVYGDEGGKLKDGVIELRRGVEDLSLGNASYAQVRIGVEGNRYLKGMALYSDNMPDGVDIIFNTNKPSSTPKMDVFKSMKKNADGTINTDNPFGATLRMEDGVIVGQSHYISSDGTEKLSAVNIVKAEGDWSKWSKTLSSQFLSKQPIETIKKQLDITFDRKENEYESIESLTNQDVKKKLLISFADSCDSAASHLKAAAMPRQESKVILPIDISDKEVYAPSFRNGEQVVLIRYPHGGTFEIPVLTVNNKSKSGISVLGKNPVDAIGISAKTAEQLSGADFDGDTVVVIPTQGQKIKTSSPLAGLVNFDPKESYGASDIRPKGSYKLMSESQKQQQMGKVSNLITDMTIKGATPSELTRAVRHSMVVIDAVKHELDYEQSYKDNGIAELKEKYQGGKNRGASTLISKASSDAYTDRLKKDGTPETRNAPIRLKNTVIFKDGVKYKDIGKVWNRYDEETKTYIPTDNKVKFKIVNGIWHYYDKSSHTYISTEKPVEYEVKVNKDKTTKMALVSDAHELSSGYIQDEIYANYANKLKALSNKCRKEADAIEPTKKSSSAADLYSSEVSSLIAKLNIAQKNSVYERKAQILADVIYRSKKQSNPDMEDDDEEIKKVKTQALAEARRRTGASKKNSAIHISDKEWEAIQAHAISSTTLSKILNNTDMDQVKKLAMPQNSRELSSIQVARIKNMINSGYSQSEIADALGISSSAVSKYIK